MWFYTATILFIPKVATLWSQNKWGWCHTNNVVLHCNPPFHTQNGQWPPSNRLSLRMFMTIEWEGRRMKKIRKPQRCASSKQSPTDWGHLRRVWCWSNLNVKVIRQCKQMIALHWEHLHQSFTILLIFCMFGILHWQALRPRECRAAWKMLKRQRNKWQYWTESSYT